MTALKRNERDTLRRYAEWTEKGWTGTLRRGRNVDAGPIVQLELGYRAASDLIGSGR